MRKSVILLMFAVMTITTGCDFFRVLAGRPTSDDIQSKRIEIMKNEEAALQARLDSIAKVESEALKTVQDSIDAFAYIRDNKVIINDASKVGGISKDELKEDMGSAGYGTRYRVVLGSFKDRSNAVKLGYAIGESGDFCPHFIVLRTGMIIVAACPSDKIQNVVWGLKELKDRAKDVCPADAWILKCDE